MMIKLKLVSGYVDICKFNFIITRSNWKCSIRMRGEPSWITWKLRGMRILNYDH